MKPSKIKPTSVKPGKSKSRNFHFTIGLVFALSLTLLAFEWSVPYERIYISEFDWEDDQLFEAQLPDVTVPDKPAPPKSTPAPPQPDPEPVAGEEQKTESNEPEDFLSGIPDDIFAPEKPDEPAVPTYESPRLVAEVMPYLCECEQAAPEQRKSCSDVELRKFLNSAVKYPELAKRKKIEGTVYVGFVVNRQGEIENAEIKKGVHPLLDKEALKAINSMPCYMPGRQSGRDVSVAFTVPVNFMLK